MIIRNSFIALLVAVIVSFQAFADDQRLCSLLLSRPPVAGGWVERLRFKIKQAIWGKKESPQPIALTTPEVSVSRVLLEVGQYVVLDGRLGRAHGALRLYPSSSPDKVIVKVVDVSSDQVTVEFSGEKFVLEPVQTARTVRDLDGFQFIKKSLETYWDGRFKQTSLEDITFFTDADVSKETIGLVATKIRHTLARIEELAGDRLTRPLRLPYVLISQKYGPALGYPQAFVENLSISEEISKEFRFLVLNPYELNHGGKFNVGVLAHELGHLADPQERVGSERFIKAVSGFLLSYPPDMLLEGFADFTAFAVTGETEIYSDSRLIRSMNKPPGDTIWDFIRNSSKDDFEQYAGTHNVGVFHAALFVELARKHGTRKIWQLFYDIRKMSYEGIERFTQIGYEPLGKAEKEQAWKSAKIINAYLEDYVASHRPELLPDFRELQKKFW